MNTAMWSVYHSREDVDRLISDPDAFLRQFDLEEDERRAIMEQDIRALLRAGAHPFLMYKMALRVWGTQFSMEKLQRYLCQLEGEHLRDIIT